MATPISKSKNKDNSKKKKSSSGKKPHPDPKKQLWINVEVSRIEKLGGDRATLDFMRTLLEQHFSGDNGWINAITSPPTHIGKYEVVLSDGEVEIASINSMGKWTITNGKHYGDLSIGSTGHNRKVLYYRERPAAPEILQELLSTLKTD